MQYRELGRTGQKLSVIGLGGIVLMGMQQNEADRYVASVVERGVNYFDVAPAYGDGEAEEKLGPALEPHRQGVFLACKTRQRDAQSAQVDLERSLRRLRTDHFDLYQLHGLATMEDVRTVLGPGGALEVAVRARQEGKARWLGFSAHSPEAAQELLRQFRFDSVLFPFNVVAYQQGFGPQVVEAAQKAGAGLLALKSLALTSYAAGTGVEQRRFAKAWYEPITDEGLASLALRFTLSLPVTAAIPPGEASMFELALRAAEHLTPLSPEERERVKQLASQTLPLFPMRDDRAGPRPPQRLPA
ncbi:MAG: aldo/keto reductase [Chloroflexota bacterium]